MGFNSAFKGLNSVDLMPAKSDTFIRAAAYNWGSLHACLSTDTN